MKPGKYLLALLCVLSLNAAWSQETDGKCFIGSSLFMLMNLAPDPASFYQLDFGYRFTEKDALIIEALTWEYRGPLGIPWGSSGESSDYSYPGYVKAWGVGIDYQHMIWKGFFSTVQATPFIQEFRDTEDKKIGSGFQLFLQLRLGYHQKIFSKRFYIEPSVVCNYWPINTDFPESFSRVERKWPNYFLFEPGLNFGINF